VEKITLGKSDLKVTPIAFGTWALGGDWGHTEDDVATAAVRGARELGINFFDTAQAYGFGLSEQVLGNALREDLNRHREDIIIATKGGIRMVDSGLERDSSPEFLREGVESSLKALNVEYIDLYQVHWPDTKRAFEDAAAGLETLVAEGKIRHVGVSNFDADQMAEFARVRPVETLQPPYHLFRRDIETEILPYCQKENVGVLVYSPLASGLLSGSLNEDSIFPEGDWRGRSPVYKGDVFKKNLDAARALEKYAQEAKGCTISQLAIAWVLSHPAVHVAILGSRSPKHIAEAIEAASITLSDEDQKQIETVMSGAVPIGGPSPEGF
jgi:aryl-alcohol dehydrogenase-like predicted oxidoreductase